MEQHYSYYPPNPYEILQSRPVEIDIPRVALIVVDDPTDVIVYRQDKAGGNNTFTASANRCYKTKFGLGIIPNGGRWNFRYPAGSDPSSYITIYDLVDPALAKGIADCMGLVSDTNAYAWGGTPLSGRDVTPDLAMLSTYQPYLATIAARVGGLNSNRNFGGAINPLQISNASATIIAANANRKSLYIENVSPAGRTLFVCFQNATAVVNKGFKIAAGKFKAWDINTDGMDTTQVNGIMDAAEAATDNVLVREGV